jgi:hypothetical protein
MCAVRFGLGKHMVSHALSVQRAISIHKVLAKSACNGGHGATATEGASTGDGVCVDDECTVLLAAGRNGAFATPDATRQPEPQRRTSVHRLAHRPMNARMADGPKIIEVSPAMARKGPNGT